jgi:Skp family chaperone for outer membrane proteins
LFKLLGCAGLLSLFVVSPAAAQAVAIASATRLAYFSPQRAFATSPDGKVAEAKLASLRAEKSKEIDERTKLLEGRRASLQQSSTVLDDAARRAREQDIQRFELDLERFVQDAQAEFAGVQRDLESAFLAKLRPALDRVARDKALLLVLNEDTGRSRGPTRRSTLPLTWFGSSISDSYPRFRAG